MKNRLKYFLRIFILFLVIILILFSVNRITLIKSLNSTTSTFRGFYEMEKNTIDVLFLGSSNCMAAFSPQEIYDEYGIRSYNLGSDQQSLITTYYWLKEALKYQRPKVVVLDVLMCFEHDGADQPLNCKESYLRKAIDYMRWSSVKMEAVAAICDNDETQNLSSYYFTNIRYHTRWTGLNEGDFTLGEWDEYYNMKGYYLYQNYCNNKNYKPFDASVAVEDTLKEAEELLPLMEEYLDKTVVLCKENDITLVLVKTPRTDWNKQRYEEILNYANAHGLDYYDFNEKNLYDEIDYQFAVDNNDNSHVNHWGAKKISNKIAQLLVDKYSVSQVADKQWENSRDFYTEMEQNADLVHITDIYDYLTAINKDRYTIFMAVKEDAATYLNEGIVELLKQLGLSADLFGRPQSSYYAIIDDGKIKEAVGDELLSTNGSFRYGRYTYSVSSAGLEYGDDCSIKVNNSERAKRKRGLNIVVFDTGIGKMIDSVCLDLADNGISVIR